MRSNALLHTALLSLPWLAKSKTSHEHPPPGVPPTPVEPPPLSPQMPMSLLFGKILGQDEILEIASDRGPLWAFGQRPSKPLEPSRDELVRSLRKALGEMRRMCCAGDPLSSGQTEWPSREWLVDLSASIRRLALLLKRGGPTTWGCIKAIELRYPALKLRKGIEDLVNRAAKLHPEPEAIRIQRQGMAGSKPAKKCFEALEKCRNGQTKIASIDWEEYREILEPLPGESCAVKAAQICIDCLSRIETPWDRLAFEIACIGNSDWALRLMSPGCATAFDNIRAEKKESRSRQLAANRKKKSRLREKVDQLAKKVDQLAKKESELVRRELEMMDSADRTEAERNAAAKRLIRYTQRTPDQWRKIFRQKSVTWGSSVHCSLLAAGRSPVRKA